jgi:hypothetical protein
MNEEIMEKINKAKQEAIENPPKKKRGCSSCKKKKNEVQELPPLEIVEPMTFTDEDVILAYQAMTHFDGILEESKVFISEVYKHLFKEEFVFDNCVSCKNNQYHKMRNYIRFHLKKRI